jgi:hypothetical protein
LSTAVAETEIFGSAPADLEDIEAADTRASAAIQAEIIAGIARDCAWRRSLSEPRPRDVLGLVRAITIHELVGHGFVNDRRGLPPYTRLTVRAADCTEVGRLGECNPGAHQSFDDYLHAIDDLLELTSSEADREQRIVSIRLADRLDVLLAGECAECASIGGRSRWAANQREIGECFALATRCYPGRNAEVVCLERFRAVQDELIATVNWSALDRVAGEVEAIGTLEGSGAIEHYLAELRR